MAKKVVYECDMPGCGAVRTPTNHWFIAECIKTELDPYSTQIRIYPFRESVIEYKSVLSSGMAILCGEACVHKYISQNLAALHSPTTKNTAVPSETDLKEILG